MLLRIGDLKFLRRNVIKGDYFYVNAFMNEKNDVIPYCKGYTEAGMRYLPLTNACKRILKEIRRVKLDSEYLFIKDPRPLATVTLTVGLRNAARNSA